MQDVIKIKLKGLNCPHCAEKITADVKKMKSLQNPEINLMKQELSAVKTQNCFEEPLLSQITEIVHKYEPNVEVFILSEKEKQKIKEVESSEFEKGLQKILLRFGAGLIFFLGGAFLNINILFLISYFLFGYDVLGRAIKNIKKGQIFDENFLMSISTIGAIFLGELAEAVFVMMFYQIGETFQSYAVDRSRKSITELMDIRTDYANLVVGQQTKKVEPTEVSIGDMIVVKAGEKIPLDGIVAEGNGELDTSALTGESLPVSVGIGERVYSGSVNKNGLLKIQVTKEFGESTVVKILEMVENASSKKSKTEQFITKFARVYTPFVVCAAVFLAIIPSIFTGNFQIWLSRALIFLVISCPCALVLSVPLGFFSGIGEASKKGILVKGSNYMDALKDVNTIIFDKTGTLTKGSFEVTQINSTENSTEKEVLELAAKAEKNSNHPIALSITEQYVTTYGNLTEEVQEYQEISGQGICCNINGKTVLAGNEKLMKQFSIDYKKYQGIGSIVYIAQDGIFMGSIVVADTIKEGSKKAIQKLKALGIKNTIMLTGDNQATANQISKELALGECYAELLPQNKVEILEKYLNKENKVIFVGDGINDAPVLARADIGVAMGGIGSDAAIEAADVVIMNDDIGKIETGIMIARNTNRIVNQNIVFALGIKAVVLVLGALGIATMWMAVFADVGVALIAILNSMRKKINESK